MLNWNKAIGASPRGDSPFCFEDYMHQQPNDCSDRCAVGAAVIRLHRALCALAAEARHPGPHLQKSHETAERPTTLMRSEAT